MDSWICETSSWYHTIVPFSCFLVPVCFDGSFDVRAFYNVPAFDSADCSRLFCCCFVCQNAFLPVVAALHAHDLLGLAINAGFRPHKPTLLVRLNFSVLVLLTLMVCLIFQACFELM